MKKILNYWPIIVFLVATLVYFWQVILKGYIPFPGDLLVGAYFPWLDSKWGFPTGVPVKNPLISDIMSQFYIWRSLVSEGWRNGQIPLWNPYSYSGYPLLATFHSQVFYPLNIVHILLGDVWGWSFLVMLPSFASAVTMYWYLRVIKTNKLGSTIGGVVYSFCGFAISWAQFITAAQAMIWMPLVFILLEKYFETKKWWILYLLPLIFFLLITSGHFQIMVYISLMTVAYFLWRWLETKDFRLILGMIIPGVLSVGLAAFQLLPTMELTKYGVRLTENYIAEYNYGLLPMKYLTTLLAPDYFGNAATGNFFGAFNYHEAIFYTGALSVFCFVLSLFLFRNNKYIRFFVIAAVLSFMFGFDTPLGKAIYLNNIPGLSTSAAGRVAVIFSMSLAVLAGIVISNIEKINYKKVLFSVGFVWLFYAVIFYLAKTSDAILTSTTNPSLLLADRRSIAIRNLILPGAFVVAYSFVLLLAKKLRVFTYLLLLMTCLEMFRFGWKYIPFVPERIVYPETPVTLFLEDKAKAEVFRIDREKAEIMPPATWMQYRFMSPSGYDPMARADYALAYQEKLNSNFDGRVSRYSELDRYDAAPLGDFNVKYLLVVKRDDTGRIRGNNINHNINMKNWTRVFETEGTAILENKEYKPRARYKDSEEGEVLISSYTPNTVKISFKEGSGKTMLLADTWYPGWKAFVNGKEVEVEQCETIFRCVKLSDNEGELIFDYQPASFWLGAKISILCLLATLGGLIILKKKNL